MARKPANVDERTALLADDERHLDHDAVPAADNVALDTEAGLSRQSIVTFTLCALCLFFITFAGSLMTSPLSEVTEEVICWQLHPEIRNGSDPLCSGSDVQGELAFINGWSLPFALAPGILTAIPYGLMADTYGRRLVLTLCLVGLSLQQVVALAILYFPNIFPIRVIWLSPLFSFIGGGAPVFTAIIFATVSGVAAGPHKTLLFSLLGTAVTAAELIGNPLAWLLMRYGAWPTIYVGVGLFTVGCVIGFFIPEVRGKLKAPEEPTESTGGTSSDGFVKRHLVAAKDKICHIVRTQFLEQRTLGLLLVSLVFTTLGKAFTFLLTQYVKGRFNWTWAETGLLNSLQGGITMVTTTLIIPLLDGLLRAKWSWTLFEKDIFLAQVSLAIMSVGYFGIGVAGSSALLLAFVSFASFSKGHEFILRSLLAQAAGEDQVGVVYTTMSMLETTGLAVSGPALSAAYQLGLRWGGVWTGLPFFLAAVLVFLGSCLVWAASRTAKVDLHQSTAEREE